MDHGLTGIGIASGIDNIKISQSGTLDRNHRFSHLARKIKAALWIQHHLRTAVTENLKGRPLGLVIVVCHLIEILAKNRIWSDRKSLARRHVHLNIFVKSRSRYADEDQDHSKMHHVPAIPARI